MLASESAAQIDDAALGRPALVIPFEDAVSLGVASDAVYVVDVATGTLTRLGLDTDSATTFAGGATRLAGPTDVDPTHGLTVWLSDAVASRLYRLTREFAVVEEIDLGRPVGSDAARLEAGGQTVVVPRHIAVVDERTIVVIDGQTSRVIWWSRDRGFERYHGSTGVRASDFEPVDVVSTPRSVIVAEQVSGCLFTFDLIGSLLGRSACDPTSDLVAINRSAGRLWVTRRIEGGTLIESRYDDGRLARRFRVQSDLRIRQAAGAAGRIWMIAEDGLYVAAVPGRADE